MAESLLALKKRAVKSGMDKAEARKAGRDTLLKYLKSADKSSSKASPAKKKGSSKPVAAKKKGAAKVTKTHKKTKATSKKKAGRPSKASSNGDAGRIEIGKIKWSMKSDDWNPRPDSGTGIIFAALKRNKGDLKATYKELKGKLSKLVPAKTRQGRKRSKEEQQADLKYRINRTKWDFAMRTGQHSAGTNRSKYGTGKYATAAKKEKRKQSRKTTMGKKRGRPAKKR
jgi:hypothetical protein